MSFANTALCSWFVFFLRVENFNFFFFWPYPWHMEVPRPGIKPMPQQQPEPLQWQHWILNALLHKSLLCLCFKSKHLKINMKKAKKKNNRNAVFEKVPRWQQQYLSATCVPLKKKKRSFCHGTAEMNLTRNHEVSGSVPGLTQWVKDPSLLWAVV